MFNTLGVTDLPIDGTRSDDKITDLLGTDPYAQGLATFISSCQTPMSIAIQGDWGSGKTSILNFLREQLETNHKETIADTIMVNTWQFSKLSEEQIFTAIICAIKDQLQNGLSDIVKDRMKKVVEAALRISTRSVGGSGEEFSFSMFENNYQQVNNLRAHFSEIIQTKLDTNPNKRIVVFVDDLDRLNPGRAVDLLESMKLFMDVPGCVFVLAVDYDVIVRGVREKYGETFSLKRCGNFFDKIIQLPFHMPVERYTMDAMVREHLSPFIKDANNLKTLSKFTTQVIGKNPRAFKRMVNAFSLIKLIQGNISTSNQPDDDDLTVLFCTLCVQIQLPTLYEYMSETAYAEWELADSENFEKLMLSKLSTELSEREQKEEIDLYNDILITFDSCIKTVFGATSKRFDRFKGIIELSAVTGRDEINRRTANTGNKGKFHVVAVLEV